MADVTGPISTLGNSVHAVPEGTMCDNHPDRPATVRRQGETDSFGCEMHDLCAECNVEWNEEIRNADTSGKCEWCKMQVDKRYDRRDYNEGMCGRIYQVCMPCIDKQNKQAQEELDEYDRGGFDDGDYDED